MRDALHQAAGIDEDQSGAMGMHLRDELVVNRRPDILPNDRAELLIGHFDAQIHFAAVPDINNRTIRRTVRQQMAGSDQQTAHFVDRFLSRAQANALQFIPDQVIEPLEGQR